MSTNRIGYFNAAANAAPAAASGVDGFTITAVGDAPGSGNISCATCRAISAGRSATATLPAGAIRTTPSPFAVTDVNPLDTAGDNVEVSPITYAP
ncbi:MAG: hypothetical protein M3071_18780 [Actinomycetota bacterium]|nr:hypothetical protein [Actinomycetota bacterium]